MNRFLVMEYLEGLFSAGKEVARKSSWIGGLSAKQPALFPKTPSAGSRQALSADGTRVLQAPDRMTSAAPTALKASETVATIAPLGLKPAETVTTIASLGLKPAETVTTIVSLGLKPAETVTTIAPLGLKPPETVTTIAPLGLRPPETLTIITAETQDNALSGAEPVQKVAISPPASNVQTSSITIDYYNFPSEIVSAFEYAAGIWESTINSPVQMTIDAYWKSMSWGVLGSSGPNDLYTDGYNLYIPTEVNRISGRDLDPSKSDSSITFNSNINWYSRTDGKTPSYSYDFVTVALHELGHAIGIAGFMEYDAATQYGYYGYDKDGNPANGIDYPLPGVYDRFTANASGQPLINYPNPSYALGKELTGSNIFFSGPKAIQANNGQKVPLYAPSTWNPGSSYSHLDEKIFPAGSVNALMTPSFAAGEVNHDPGPIARGFLQDLGWNINAQNAHIYDSRKDILLAHPSGSWSGIWVMNGKVPSGWIALPSAGGGSPTAAGDFNNDGQDDIIIADRSGAWSGIWTMKDSKPVAWTALPYAGGGVPLTTGDFNNDGQVDIIVGDPRGSWSGIWFMNGSTPVAWKQLPYASGGVPQATGDFNKDGQVDIIIGDPRGSWTGIWTMAGSIPVAWKQLPYAGGGVPLATGDFDNNSQVDIIVGDPNGAWSGIWTMSGTQPIVWNQLPYAGGAIPV